MCFVFQKPSGIKRSPLGFYFYAMLNTFGGDCLRYAIVKGIFSYDHDKHLPSLPCKGVAYRKVNTANDLPPFV